MVGKILAVGLVCVGMAVGQEPTALTGKTIITVPAKEYRFEVVSIRQNISLMHGDMGKPTANGYRMTNWSLGLVMDTAYVPQTAASAFYSPGQVKGLPDWVNRELYDIDARISEEDRTAWQNPGEQRVMLQSMLQAMLVERCKLMVHREIKDASVYALVIGKNGIKFKETDTTADLPSGLKLPWGGVLVNSRQDRSMRFYGTSMASLASFLSNIVSSMGQHEEMVQDKTGLTGRYDFVVKLPLIEPRVQGEVQGENPAPADDPSSFAFRAAESLGLKLEKNKGLIETLVIDHMERPSAN